MDLTVLVQNIKMRCKAMGVSPSKAAKDSGAGEALITSIERKGSVPSIEKIQQLATYLGCTVSDLLGESTGEKKEPVIVTDDELDPKYSKLKQLIFDAEAGKAKAGFVFGFGGDGEAIELDDEEYRALKAYLEIKRAEHKEK